MSFTETQPPLPWQGNNPTTRHTSQQAAVSAAETRIYKSTVYLQWLRRVGRATDWQAADELGWLLSSITSIRNGLVDRGQVEVAGTVEGKHGRKVALWRTIRERDE
jgi:hypothetical protein